MLNESRKVEIEGATTRVAAFPEAFLGFLQRDSVLFFPDHPSLAKDLYVRNVVEAAANQGAHVAVVGCDYLNPSRQEEWKAFASKRMDFYDAAAPCLTSGELYDVVLVVSDVHPMTGLVDTQLEEFLEDLAGLSWGKDACFILMTHPEDEYDATKDNYRTFNLVTNEYLRTAREN